MYCTHTTTWIEGKKEIICCWKGRGLKKKKIAYGGHGSETLWVLLRSNPTPCSLLSDLKLFDCHGCLVLLRAKDHVLMGTWTHFPHFCHQKNCCCSSLWMHEIDQQQTFCWTISCKLLLEKWSLAPVAKQHVSRLFASMIVLSNKQGLNGI